MTASRDVYGKHFSDLSPKQTRQLLEFVALWFVERDEEAKKWGA